MNEADLYKLAEKYDEDFLLADIEDFKENDENVSNEKLQNNSNFSENFNKNYVKSVQNAENNKEGSQKKTESKLKKKKNSNAFKESYFSFYDDIKTSSNHKNEW